MKENVKRIYKQYRTDLRYRAELMLYINFAINVFYALFEGICAYILSSKWMGTLAFYYIVLSFLRMYILKKRKKGDFASRKRTYRVCGGVLLLLTIALLGIHILTMNRTHVIEYPGYMIYAIAAYTFYVAINAVRNVILYRKLNDPLLSASKAIGIAVAAISMYQLQSAMITAFGKGDEAFRITMGNAVGIGVFALIVGISLLMLFGVGMKQQESR